MKQANLKDQFNGLADALNIFIRQVKDKNLSLMATDQWKVKDVLCHIVFWHENYAANYKALAHRKEPPLFDAPGYILNKKSVSSLQKFSVTVLIKRLLKANAVLRRNIIVNKVPRMTYKKNGRVYTSLQFLDLVKRHLATHTKQISRARQKALKFK